MNDNKKIIIEFKSGYYNVIVTECFFNTLGDIREKRMYVYESPDDWRANEVATAIRLALSL